MNHVDLAAYDSIRIAFSAGLWLCAGAVVGALHFTTLRWNAAAFADGGSLLLPFGIQLFRLLATTAMLFGIAWIFGAVPLLVAAVGILIARTVIVRRGVPS